MMMQRTKRWSLMVGVLVLHFCWQDLLVIMEGDSIVVVSAAKDDGGGVGEGISHWNEGELWVGAHGGGRRKKRISPPAAAVHRKEDRQRNLKDEATEAPPLRSQQPNPGFYDMLRENDDTGVNGTTIKSWKTKPGSNVVEVTFLPGGDDEGSPPASSSTSRRQESETIRLCHLATFLPFGRTSLQSEATTSAAVAYLAMTHFNHRNPVMVPNLDLWTSSCNIRLTMEFIDTSYSPIRAVTPLVSDLMVRNHSLGTPKPIAVVGPRFSSSSTAFSIIGGMSGIPNVSHKSTSALLDNTDTHRMFGRTIPNSGGDARAAAHYFANVLNVTHVACIFPQTSYGSSFANDFTSAASDYNLEVFPVPHAAFTSGDRESLRDAMARVKKSGRRHIMFPTHSATYRMAMSEAYREGLVGDDYFWLLGDGGTMVLDDKFELDKEMERDVIAATNGIGIVLADAASNPTYEAAWGEGWKTEDAGEDTDLAKYFRLKLPDHIDFGNYEFPASPSTTTSMMYDAVMSLALASCNTYEQYDGFFDGESLFKRFKRVEFEGASGDVRFDRTTGTRDSTTMIYTITNVVANDEAAAGEEDDGFVRFSKTVTNVARYSESKSDGTSSASTLEWTPVGGVSFVYANGRSEAPAFLPPLEAEDNTIPTPILVIGWSLAGIVLVLSLSLACWVWLHRLTDVVRISQPSFLYALTAGTCLMGLSIVPMGAQEPASVSLLHASCMASIWLLQIGFVISFSALFSRAFRLNEISHATRGVRRRRILPAWQAILPFAVIFILSVATLAIWTVVAPLRWERQDKPSSVDKFGRQTESFGMCIGEQTAVFALLLLVIDLGAILLAAFQSFLSRNVASKYNEGFWVSSSIFLVLQSFAIGLPALLIVSATPLANFVVRSVLVVLVCCVILLPIFLPKVWVQVPRGAGGRLRKLRSSRRPKQMTWSQVVEEVVDARSSSSDNSILWTKPREHQVYDSSSFYRVGRLSAVEEKSESSASSSSWRGSNAMMNSLDNLAL